jgi:AcrR family transcriptional regulator
MADEKTKERILTAAREEFIQHGYNGARMRAIAERAEINKGLLHYYFGSKDALFEAVFAQVFDQSMQEFSRILDPSADLFASIARYVEVHLDKLVKNPFVPMYIMQETNRDPQRLMQLMGQKVGDSFLQRFEQRITQEVEAGHIQAVCPKHFVVSLVAMVVFPVLQKPLLEVIHGMDEQQYQQFLEERKAFIPAFVKAALTNTQRIVPIKQSLKNHES